MRNQLTRTLPCRKRPQSLARQFVRVLLAQRHIVRSDELRRRLAVSTEVEIPQEEGSEPTSGGTSRLVVHRYPVRVERRRWGVWWFVKEQDPVNPESCGLRKRRSSKQRTWVLEKLEKCIDVARDKQEELL
jgi:hypothetical protein